MDYLSSKYMLPIGGMLTGVFILYRWGVLNFMAELKTGMSEMKINPLIVTVLFSISAIVVGFIILNEIVEKLSGTPLFG